MRLMESQVTSQSGLLIRLEDWSSQSGAFLSRGIYVAPADRGGEDFAGCGSLSQPCETISFGIERDGNAQINIYDIQGRLIEETNSQESRIQLNTQDLEVGAYILHIQSTDLMLSKNIKFIKQ